MDVELDRRMLDFIVGLDSELSELVEGSHLYTSTVKLDRVILPERQKTHIVESVKNFEQLQKAKKKLNLDEFMSYGAGMVLLVRITFCYASGYLSLFHSSTESLAQERL